MATPRLAAQSRRDIDSAAHQQFDSDLGHIYAEPLPGLLESRECRNRRGRAATRTNALIPSAQHGARFRSAPNCPRTPGFGVRTNVAVGMTIRREREEGGVSSLADRRLFDRRVNQLDISPSASAARLRPRDHLGTLLDAYDTGLASYAFPGNSRKLSPVPHPTSITTLPGFSWRRATARRRIRRSETEFKS